MSDDMTVRAIGAFYHRTKIQPSATLSRREGDQIILENVNGELARYKVVKRKGAECVRFMDAV